MPETVSVLRENERRGLLREGQPVPLNILKTQSSCDEKDLRGEKLFELSGLGVYVSSLINHTRMSPFGYWRNLEHTK